MKTVLLGDVAEVLGGGTPSTKNEAYWNGDIPWITPRDLSSHINTYIETGDRKITEAGLKNSSAKVLPSGAVIFSSRAPIGYVTIASNPMATNQGCKGIICKNDRLNNRFLFYWLKINKERIESLAGGSTFKEISTSGVRNLEINLPDFITQNEVAEILGKIDEKIELNRRTNETLEQLGHALFKHYFIDNPEAKIWTKSKFSDFTEVITGKGSTKSVLAEGGKYPLYGAGGIMGTSDKYLLDEPLIITGRVGTLGRIQAVTGKAWFSDNVLIMKPKPGYFGLVYYLVKSFDFVSMNRGSSQPLVTQTDLKNRSVKSPDEKTLLESESQFQVVFNLMQKNEKEIITLGELRDLLLPRLISGKLKV